jgi:hypothetical protein
MNPFGEMTWPVTLSLYNIPSWLCHKRKYLMLTTLISRTKQVGIDMGVFRTFNGRHAETMGRRGPCLGCVLTRELHPKNHDLCYHQ